MQQQTSYIDIYEHVTNTIIALLEQGTVPWQKPWITSGPPRNLLTGHWYAGINYMLLNALPYKLPYYLTFRQVKSVAGKVKAGEKAHMLVFRRQITEPDKNDATKTVIRFVLRHFWVFNISQCENIPPHLIGKAQLLLKHKDPIQECEFVVEGYKTCPTIRYSGDEAYYHSVLDVVNMPFMEKFVSQEKFYSALFHELVHSTGHASRLNRKEVVEANEFGSDEYSVEELVAEMGACYISSFCGIVSETIDNSAAYINGWLNSLKNDKKFIVQASSRAQKAVDYILNIDRSREKNTDVPAEPESA